MLVIGEERNITGLPPGARGLIIDTRLAPQPLAEVILRGLQSVGGINVLVNNFGPSLTSIRMEERQTWALSAPPQVRACFAATRAFLTLSKQGRGLVVNLGVGIGPVDQPCPMRYALLGFVRSLGLMGMKNIEVANLCCHNLYGQQPGGCRLCALDTLLTAPAPSGVTLFEQVSELILEAINRFRGAAKAGAEGG